MNQPSSSTSSTSHHGADDSQYFSRISEDGSRRKESVVADSASGKNNDETKRDKLHTTKTTPSSIFRWMEEAQLAGHRYEIIKVPEDWFESKHVVWGLFCRNHEFLPRFDLYRRVPPLLMLHHQDTSEVLVANVRFGPLTEGHEGLVHGGILGLICDDLMGMASHCLTDVVGLADPVFTANLNLDFRRPVPVETEVIVRFSLVKRDGRKLYFTGQMTSPDGSLLYLDTSGLMIIAKSML